MPGPSEWVGDNRWFHFEEYTQSPFFKNVTVDHSFTCWAAAQRYWADYPDIAANNNYNVNPMTAYRHFIDYGRYEGRIWHSELCTGAQFLIRIQVLTSTTPAYPADEVHGSTCVLFNVEERIFVTRTYPNRVLLGLRNIPANQVPSLQSMAVSVLAKGQKVAIPDANGNLTIAWTRQRAWILRHLMTNPRVGMGYEIDANEINDLQWLNDAQNYWDELVPAQGGGTEPRDLCDVVIAERRWDWDWVKLIAGEGRAAIFQSGGQWILKVDKPGSPDLLFSEPGNIIEGSITMEISPPDKYFNQLISEFRDEEDLYRPNITQPINGPDTPYPSIVQEDIQWQTITRESQAMRENMVILKRAMLERRRWTFTSPQSAIVKEPLDLDWLCERVVGEEGCYTGYLPAGSTSTVITLDRPVVLEAPDIGDSYILTIQHRDGSTAETRTVTNTPGTYIQVTVSQAFSKPILENDIYAFGRAVKDYIVTRCRDLTIDNQFRVQQIRSEYIEEIYDPDPLPPSINRKFFPFGGELLPIPLRNGAVNSQLVQNRDGSWRTVITFDVTPGLEVHGGMTWTGGTWSAVEESILDPNTEPGRNQNEQQADANDYYVGAEYTATSGLNAGLKRRIVIYDSWNYVVFFDMPFPYPLHNGDTYEIRWPKFGEFDGFKIERSTDRLIFTEVARAKGVHYEMDGGDQSGTYAFRMTPFNPSSAENKVAPIIRSITLVADTSPPTAPYYLYLGSQYKTVNFDVYLALPLAEDLAAIEYELWDGTGNGVLFRTGRYGLNQDTRLSGTAQIRFSVNLEWLPYNTYVWGRVRTADYSGNVSAWMNTANTTQLLQVFTPDIGPGAVATIQYVHSETPVVLIEPQFGSSLLLSAWITTIGGSIDIQAKITAYGTGDLQTTTWLLGRSNTPGDIGGLVGLDGIGGPDGGSMMASETITAGTWLYEVWGSCIANTGGVTCSSSKLKVQENRGGFD